MSPQPSQRYQIKFLPAEDGDAILIRYGQDDDLQSILIDGGRTSTGDIIKAELKASPQDPSELELLVISHIDADHIESLQKILAEDEPGFTARDTWYNGWHHMADLLEEKEDPDESFGVRQAELFSGDLHRKGWPWNTAFSNKAVVISDTEQTIKQLPGGMKLTLLSPDRDKLTALYPVWEKELKSYEIDLYRPAPPEEGEESFGEVEPDVDTLAAERFFEDKREGNGASIAFIAEYAGKRVLFAGDAHPKLLVKSLDRLSPDGPVEFDLVKLSHHGSKKNTSRDLLKKLSCNRYLFSSNGRSHHHPDQQCVARVIKYGGDAPQLYFNYRTAYNEMWDSDRLRDEWGYTTHYGDEGMIEIDL